MVNPHSITPNLWLLLAFMAAMAPAADPPPLMTRFAPDRQAIYAGEQFSLVLSIYVRDMNLGKEVSIGNLPPADRLQIEPFAELPVEYATVGQRIYEVRHYRCAARAAQPGRLEIKLSLDGKLIYVVRSFFFSQQEERPVKIPVEPLALEILPLPSAGRPAGFSGTVGRDIELGASIEPADVAVGDLITFTTIIKGSGLPLDMKPPAITVSPDFKIYPPKTAPSAAKDVRQFEQIFIPLNTNAAKLGPVSFTYFDTAAGAYITRAKDPFSIAFHPEKQPDGKFYRPPPSVSSDKVAPPIELRPWRGKAGKSDESKIMFDRATELTRNGGLREATDLYARLISAGNREVAVFYNLSQLQFAGGQFDQAILNLRRAMRRSPGDRGLQETFEKAMTAARAIASAADHGLVRFALAIALPTWKLALGAGLLLLTAGTVFIRRRKNAAVRAMLFLGLFLAVSGAMALAAWSRYEARDEAVIVEAQATAYLAPAETSRPLAKLLPGSVVRITERHSQWVRVTCDGISGWVLLSAVALVE